jgi:hypothetical protein
VVEKILGEAGVHQEALVAHHDVHVGDAPIGIPVAAQQERDEEPAEDEGDRPGPAKENQPGHAVALG